jgi:hypothetical protein
MTARNNASRKLQDSFRRVHSAAAFEAVATTLNPDKQRPTPLGMRDFGTRELAERLGAKHLLDHPEWMQAVKEAARNPSTRISVNLSGFSGETTYGQLMGAAARGMTPGARYTEWEIGQLYQAGRMGDLNLVDRAGAAIGNPFK